MEVRHSAEIIIGDYQFAESLNKEVLHQLQFAENIGHTNVKASLHTEWDWLPDNQKIKNFGLLSHLKLKIISNQEIKLVINVSMENNSFLGQRL